MLGKGLDGFPLSTTAVDKYEVHVHVVNAGR